jgi:hypothetical protein
MGGVRLPRRRCGARRVSSGHATDSPPRHRTSRLPRLVVTSAHRAPGASPLSSVLAGTASAAGLRSSARPSRSSEGRPDGLGSRNEEVGSRFQRRRCALHDVGTLRELLGACAEDLGPSPQSPDACPRGRGGPFDAIGTTVWVLSATSEVLGRTSHVLGSIAHALGRTPQVVGNCRPCLEACSVVADGALALALWFPLGGSGWCRPIWSSSRRPLA